MLLDEQLVRAAYESARQGFNPIGTNIGATLNDEIQDELYVAAIPIDIPKLGLSIIEQLGVAHTVGVADRAVEAIGMILAHGSVIAGALRLSFGPVMALAERIRYEQIPIKALRVSSAVAAATMWPRPEPRLTVWMPDAVAHALDVIDALALAIARSVDHVEMSYDVAINLPDLHASFARELLAGRRDPAARRGISTSRAPDSTSNTVVAAVTDRHGSTEVENVADTEELSAQDFAPLFTPRGPRGKK